MSYPPGARNLRDSHIAPNGPGDLVSAGVHCDGGGLTMARFLQRRMALIGGLVVVGVLAAAGLGGAAGVADHAYHGCYQSNGNVYLISESGLRTSCRNGDTEFSFSLQGPIGPQGAQGARGPQGDQGPQGAKGDPGVNGVDMRSTTLPVGDPTCAAGGVQLVSANATTDVCNGANGSDGANGAQGPKGADGMNVQATPLATGDPNCPTGGVKLQAASSTAYVCNGAQGAQGAPGTTGGSTAAAPDRYAGGYLLTVDGVSVGPVHLLDGCANAASVVNLASVALALPVKTIGSPAAEPCEFEFGENVTAVLWQWFQADFAGGLAPTHDFAFERVDGTGHVTSSISCTAGFATRLSVPRLVPGAASSFLLNGELTADRCQRPSAGGTNVVSTAPIQPFSSGEVQASINDVAGGPSSIDAFATNLVTARGAVGEQRIATLDPVRTEIPNLRLHYDQAAAVADLQSWFLSFVIQGNDGAAQERTTVVSLHNGGVTLTFGHSGIFRLDPEERVSDNAYRADLYNESMTIAGLDAS